MCLSSRCSFCCRSCSFWIPFIVITLVSAASEILVEHGAIQGCSIYAAVLTVSAKGDFSHCSFRILSSVHTYICCFVASSTDRNKSRSYHIGTRGGTRRIGIYLLPLPASLPCERLAHSLAQLGVCRYTLLAPAFLSLLLECLRNEYRGPCAVLPRSALCGLHL